MTTTVRAADLTMTIAHAVVSTTTDRVVNAVSVMMTVRVAALTMMTVQGTVLMTTARVATAVSMTVPATVAVPMTRNRAVAARDM
jgi:hypothetical protein